MREENSWLRVSRLFLSLWKKYDFPSRKISLKSLLFLSVLCNLVPDFFKKISTSKKGDEHIFIGDLYSKSLESKSNFIYCCLIPSSPDSSIALRS